MPQPPAPTPPGSPWGGVNGGVSPEATPAELAQLAANRPDLWAAITEHPNCYEGLRAWIADNGGASARDAGVAPDTVGLPDADATMTAASFEEATRTMFAGEHDSGATRTVAASGFDADEAANPVSNPASMPPPNAWLPPAADGWAAPAAAAVAPEPMPPLDPTLLPPSAMTPPQSAAWPAAPDPGLASSIPPAPGATVPGVGFPGAGFPGGAGGGPAGPIAFDALMPPGAPGLPQPTDETPAKKKRGKAWIAGAAVAALVLSGGGVALALTDTWPFGAESGFGGAAATQAGQQDDGPTFADGFEAKWTVSGEDLGEDTVMAHSLPRMMGPINVASRANKPVQLESGVLLHHWPSSGQGDVPASWTLLNSQTGEPEWTEETGFPTSCSTDHGSTQAFCITTFVGGTDVMRFDADGAEPLGRAEPGTVQYFNDELRLLSENKLEARSLEGKELKTLDVSEVSGATVGNARNPDCVWLSGGDTASYAGTICDAPDEEVLVTTTEFNWAVVGDKRPIMLIDEPDQLLAFDAKTRELLWSSNKKLPGWFQAPQLIEREDGPGLLVESRSESDSTFAVADLETGEEVKLDSEISPSTGVVAKNQVLLFDYSEGSVSKMEAFDGSSGKLLNSESIPDAGYVSEITGGPLGVLFGHPMCTDCSTADGASTIDSYTFYGPADTKKEATNAVKAAGIPDSIPLECPADTKLLAWAEFEDGWVLVCGISQSEPTYLAFQSSEASSTEFSIGSNKPTSAEAKAAVNWDAGLSRYTADLVGGERVTLDYDIGTLVRRDSADNKTLEQQRFARYVFLSLGEKVRTVKETSNEGGAFDVKAPKDTAEDQVRYMIEVLEKAYDGRSMVREALPKLQNCTASAGGYSDTVSAMEAVRDNRAELLSALDAMPVDKIPEGSALLDDLYEAIETSHEANLEYVTWAENANASGCASLSSAGQAAAAASDPPKERFATRWNRVVASKFGVRTFDAGQI